MRRSTKLTSDIRNRPRQRDVSGIGVREEGIDDKRNEASGQLGRWRSAPRVRDGCRRWKAVMGSRCVCSKLAVAPYPFLVQLLIFSLMAQAAAKPHECQVDKCTQEHQESLDLESGSSLSNCFVLRSYIECLRTTGRSCRGDLSYHTISSLVLARYTEFNCSELNGKTGESPPPTPKPTRRPPPKECTYHGRHDIRMCSLFGDPHLITFNGKPQTCKVLGTWPLIDNAFLAVQVTNEAVALGSKATATSMVTIIIKGRSPCSLEKTYEAQTNNLPATFVDGTQSSGPDQSVRIKERETGRHVQISVKYIATTIIVRQLGRYLTVVIRAPRDVALLGSESDSLHLCVRGCPSWERINHRLLLADPTSLRDEEGRPQKVAMPPDEAVAQCKRNNLTNFYYESCVFDLLTTGDSSFGHAASEAMRDGWPADRAAGAPNGTATLETGGGTLPVDFEETAGGRGRASGGGRSAGESAWTVLCTLVLLFLVTNR